MECSKRRTASFPRRFLASLLLATTGCSGARRATPTVPPDEARRLTEPAVSRPSVAAPAVESPARHREFVLGHSREHRPIVVHELGEGPTRTVIVAAIHGDEPIAAELADRLVQHFRTLPSGQLEGRVLVIPRMNPDGLARRTRANAAGVDLNRNFPAGNWRRTAPRGGTYGGPSPLSEPESALLARLLDERRPARLISIHAMHRGACNNYDGPGKAMADLMRRHNGYPVLAGIGYPTPGSLGSFAGNDRGIPMVTLELPKSATIDAVWAGNRDALTHVVRGARVSTEP